MTPQQRKILEDYISKKNKRASINLEALCFPKQLDFINDPALFVTAVTSRRAGKTTACALHLLHVANENPKTVCLYITLARTNAKKIIWPMLKDLNEELKLNGIANESDLSMKLPNNSIIYCSGAATASEIDRFRGLALKLVYIDEAQSFGLYLDKLIDDVLVPACFDNRGQIRLIGTPGPVPVGFFYSANNNSNWSKHSWTMFDNPWIERKRGESPKAILDQELIRRGVSVDDPTIQREVFGKWVTDTATLVLHYNKEINHYDDLPTDTYNYIMGIDLGFKDADAICILGHSANSPVSYLVDELVTTKQGITELMQQVEFLRNKYNCYKLVIDTGGLGLKIAEEMRRRWRIPVHAADKKRKFENLEILNDALRTARFRAKENSRFANDSMLLEWDMDKLKPDRRIVSDRFHSDIIDATLYAFKESPAFSYTEPKPIPIYGSPEWAKEEVERMQKEAEEYFQKEEEINYEKEQELNWL